jgi:hypothetical protein
MRKMCSAALGSAKTCGEPIDFLFMDPDHSFLESSQLVAIVHALFPVLIRFWAAPARTFDGLDDHLLVVVHFFTPPRWTNEFGVHKDLTFFHCSKLSTPVNQNIT